MNIKRIYILSIISLAWICAGASIPKVLSPHSIHALKAERPSVQEQTVSAYITIDPDRIDKSTLEAAGVSVAMEVGNILTAHFPIALLDRIARMEGVSYIQVATPVKQMLDIAAPEVGIRRVQSAEALEMPYTGKGVVIGIVDSGFDYGHPAFRDSNGGLRIKRVWEQTTQPTADLFSPEPFGYGVEFTIPELLLAAGGDIFNNSHGTHVASIAAGSDDYLDGSLKGMAPDAEIVLVSMREAGAGNVNISDAISYIFRYADEVGKPCVVNLSLGAQSGPHDGTSTFDVIADRLQGPGRLIVGASGNHTAEDFHVAKSFADGDDSPLRSFIHYKSSGTGSLGGQIEVWSDADVEVALLVVKPADGTVSERVVIYPTDEATTSVSLGRNVSGSFEVSGEVSPLNDKHHVLLTNQVTSIRTNYAIAIEVKPLSGGKADIWADDISLGLESRDVEGYTDPAGFSTVSEIGGTARSILTVGAYTTRSTYRLLGESTDRSLEETDGDLGSFSNCGPTADGRIKPQVTAPGCFISAAVSNYDKSGTISRSHYYHDGHRDCYYGYMQGTSMAAPMVTGIVATWLQAWPEMDPEGLLEVVKSTARTDAFTGDVAQGSNRWGYGKIDALAGIKECIQRNESGSLGGVIADPDGAVSIYKNAAGEYAVLFAADAANATIEVFATTGALLSRFVIAGVESASTHNVSVPSSTDGPFIIRVSTPGATVTKKLF